MVVQEAPRDQPDVVPGEDFTGVGAAETWGAEEGGREGFGSWAGACVERGAARPVQVGSGVTGKGGVEDECQVSSSGWGIVGNKTGVCVCVCVCVCACVCVCGVGAGARGGVSHAL